MYYLILGFTVGIAFAPIVNFLAWLLVRRRGKWVPDTTERRQMWIREDKR